AAEAIILEEVARARADMRRRHADPAISELIDEMESRRRRLLGAVPGDFSPEQVEEVDRITRAITARLLHQPILYLRENTRDAKALDRVRRILGLGEAEEDT